MKSYSYILTIIVICLTGFTSCVDKIALPETTAPAKIHVECELSPPFHIKAKLSTTGDFNANYLPTFPEDATIRLYSQLDEEFVFKYNSDTRIYEVTNGRLRNGLNYSISAEVKDSSITSVFANTKIPPKGSIDSLEIVNIESINSNTGPSEDLVTVKVNLDQASGKYFRIFFDSRYATLKENVNQSQWIYNPVLQKSEISSIKSGGTSVHDAYHLRGVLVNPEYLDDTSFEVVLKTDKSSLESKEVLKTLNIRIHSVTESYYRYHLALSKQLKLEGRKAIEPVIDYTNINNGYGFIGAFVASSDSIVVR
ncbi:MAG: DUF4249 family protein [Saprospiraceae bacterium]|nr:DUF4249 family protein [Saprospiraceae bacterium]